MSIPKIIHYCWFGRNPKPVLAEKCMKSWRKYCPDYQIIEWNEENYDISDCPLYVRQAYEARKWAFVTDYVRLDIVYRHGGIYLDTDVELRKSLDTLLTYPGYFGFEDGVHVSTGLGFGAGKGLLLLKELMDDYAEIPFVREDGLFDTMTCPVRNTQILLQHGLVQDDSEQFLDDGVLVLPSRYLCPISYSDGRKRIVRDTISIHWFQASWQTTQQREEHKKHKKAVAKIRRDTALDRLIHFPNRLGRAVLGNDMYESLKRKIKTR